MSETPVYAVIGHGSEEPIPFEERFVVPEGYTIVLLTKPGQPFSSDSAESVWETMFKNANLFTNPVANKQAIEESTNVSLRIYEPGSRIPDMRYNPESFFPYQPAPPSFIKGHKPLARPAYILHAGIYKLPLEFGNFDSKRINGGLMNHFSGYRALTYSHLTYLQLQSLYSGDANKKILEKIIERFGATPPVERLKELTYQIQDLLPMNGPGVYYFFNCRYVRGLQTKLFDFIDRYIAELKKQISRMDEKMPPEPKTKEESMIYSQWRSFWYLLYRDFGSIRDLLTELRTASNMLPEEKLLWLRNILLNGSYLEGNNSLKGAAPIENEALQNTVTRMLALERVPNHNHFFAPINRIFLKEFDEEFGTLQTRLHAIRTMSNVAQKKYNGGKRKTKRKTNQRKTRRRRV